MSLSAPALKQWHIVPVGNGTMAHFHIVLPSGELPVRQALGDLRDTLAGWGLGEADLGSVELVLGEVLNNVVEHAYGPNGSGDIALSCSGDGGAALRFAVIDSGAPLPGLRLPAGNPANLDCARDDLPEGGFGWFLVRTLTRNLRYRRNGAQNELEFDIKVQGDAPANAG